MTALVTKPTPTVPGSYPGIHRRERGDTATRVDTENGRTRPFCEANQRPALERLRSQVTHELEVRARTPTPRRQTPAE